jgi:alkanesulfonate monooxygenase SsuD/methylene tetrahydromethanopterin reductase-like flavin-dependent oxidoreductase (luciferase family)
LARELNARRLWIGQSLRIESHHVLSVLAAENPGLPLGSCVALTPLRHPYQAATEARSIAILSGASYVAGYGPAQPEFQEALLGRPYGRQLRAMHEYADIMRGLLDGGVVEREGEYHSVRARLFPQAAPPVEVGLGVLRTGMARTAGRVADAAITWLAPHWYIRDRIGPALHAGAAESGRPVPRVVMVVHVAVTRPMRNLRRIVEAATAMHLVAPHYTDMLRQAGVPADAADPVAGARALLDADVFLTGSPERIAAALSTYRASGVDEIVLNTSGVYLTSGTTAAMRDIREVMEAAQ